ncbi:restriction endonuclease subunit S [Bowmanella denitrificans]|uniref:restriction endonuclease subunit S n=1 Tax=Bowmanella denitrificans TaxID=366582 RepID=UPI000C99C3B7|nr:restriction endonuclease subunit S [Bowmanella denitrificans]
MSEKLEALPRGWFEVQLYEAIDIHDYERQPVNNSERNSRIEGKTTESLYPYYGATGQVGWIDDYLSNEDSVLLGEDGAPFLDPYKDKAYLVAGKYWVNNHAHILRGHKNLVNNKFICYQLNILDYADFVSGTTRLKLTKSALEKLPFRICPHREQSRIVEKLEELLSDLDNGVEELKAAQTKLTQYRQSLLKSAVEGSLTEQWREENAVTITETGEQLLERILKERRSRWETQKLAEFKAKGQTPPKNWQDKYPEPVQPDTSELPELPEGWVWASLDMLISSIEAGKSFKCLERHPVYDEYGVVKVSAVTWGEYDELESKTCTRKDYENDSVLIKQGDFLFSRANTTELVGACVIAERVTKKIMLSDKILRINFIEDSIKYWLLQFLRSQWGRQQIEAAASGNQASMKNISQGKLKGFTVPLPSKDEIYKVEGDLFSAFENIQKSSAEAEITQRTLLAQRKNILKDAFAGKLVPQDPNDEPASVLLEKIQAERAERAKLAKSKPKAAKKKAGSRVTIMDKLENVLKNKDDWMDAQEAFKACGVTDGTDTDRIEELYAELRRLDQAGRLEVERHGNYDMIKLKGE